MQQYNLSRHQYQQPKTENPIFDRKDVRQRYAISPSGHAMCLVAETDPRAAGNTKPSKRRKGWTRRGLIRFCDFILRDIATVILDAFGGPCDRTDDGEWLFEVVLPFLVARAVAKGTPEEEINTMRWAQFYCRRLACDRSRAWFLERESAILTAFGDRNGCPSTLGASADSVSRDLRLTQAKADELGLHSLSGMERPWTVRQREHKAQDAAKHRDKRKAAGAVPHEESMSRTKPWEKAGYNSESTWRRAIKAGKAPPDARMRVARKAAKAGKPTLRLIVGM